MDLLDRFVAHKILPAMGFIASFFFFLCVAAEFIRLSQYFLGWKTLTYLYRFNLTGKFRITAEFFITEYFQPLPDSIDGVRDSFTILLILSEK